LLSLDQGNIYLTKNNVNYNDITKLKEEYKKLYQEALILKDNPESEEYQKNKRLRQANLDARLELLGG
jgi:acyl-[acyl carrier protein]--UDP-N-acetylglucosamine O-acyltransferase